MPQQAQEIFGNFFTMKRLLMVHFRETLHGHDFGLTPSQLEVLFAVHALQPLCFKDISRHLMIQPAAVTQIVDFLTDEGLVTRTMSEHDRRTWFLNLTDSGQKKITECKPYLHARKRLLYDALTDSEVHELIRIQTKIIAHLQEALDDKTK